jgi:hypothetical protein
MAKQGLQLGRNRRALIVARHRVDELVRTVEMMRGGGSMAGVAEGAVVPRRNEARDHLALAAGQRVGSTQQNFYPPY